MNRGLISFKDGYLYLANDGREFNRLGVISVCLSNMSSKDTDEDLRTLDEYDCEDDELISKLRHDAIEPYKKSKNALRAAAKAEINTITDYGSRWILEAIQNMDDALGGNDARASIGTKGRGFLSLMKIAEDVSIFSGPFKFCFSKERSILGLKNEGIEFASDKIPYMSIPWEAQSDSMTKKLFSEGYATVIRLGISDPNVDEAIEDAENLDSRFLLFTKNISILDISIKDYKNTIERKINYLSNSTPFVKKEHIVLENLLNGDKSKNSYLKWSKDWKVDERKDANVSVCLEIKRTGKYKISSGKIQKIYNYFPTQETINGNIFLNISLPLTSNRDNFIETDKNDFPDVYESLREIIECICLDEDGCPEDVIRIFSGIGSVNNHDRNKTNYRIHVDIINSVRNVRFIPSIVSGEKIAAVDARSWKAADLALCFDYTKLENTAKPKEPFIFLLGESINLLEDELEKLKIKEVDSNFINLLFDYIETNGEECVTLINRSPKDRKKIHESLNEYLTCFEFSDTLLTSKIFADRNSNPLGLERDKIYKAERELVPKFLTPHKISKETVRLTAESNYYWNSLSSRFYIFSEPYYCLNYFHNNILDSSEEFLEYYLLFAYMSFLENSESFSVKISQFKKTLKLPISGNKWGSIDNCVLDDSFGSSENEKEYLRHIANTSNSQLTDTYGKYQRILKKCYSDLEDKSNIFEVKKRSIKEFLLQIGVSINPVIKEIKLVEKNTLDLFFGKAEFDHWHLYSNNLSYPWCEEEVYIQNFVLFICNLSEKRVFDYLKNAELGEARYKRRASLVGTYWPDNGYKSFLHYQLVNTACIPVKKSIIHLTGKACLKELIISDKTCSPFASLSRAQLIEHFADEEQLDDFIIKYKLKTDLISALRKMTFSDCGEVISDAISNINMLENIDNQSFNQLKTLCVAVMVTHPQRSIFLPAYLPDNSLVCRIDTNVFINDLDLSKDQVTEFEINDRSLFIMSLEDLKIEVKEFGKKYDLEITEFISRLGEPGYPYKLSDIIEYDVSYEEIDSQINEEIFRSLKEKWPLIVALAKREGIDEVSFNEFKESFVLCDYLALRVVNAANADDHRDSEILTEHIKYKNLRYFTVDEFMNALPAILASETFPSSNKIAGVSVLSRILEARDEIVIQKILRDEEIPENIIARSIWEGIGNSPQNHEEERPNDIAKEKNLSKSEVTDSGRTIDTGSDPQSTDQNSSTTNSRSTRATSSGSNRSAPNMLRSGRAKNRGHLRASDENNRSNVLIFDDEMPDNKSFGDRCERIVESLLKGRGYTDVNLLGEQNKGYDIEYKEDGVTKFVEVKGLRGSWDSADIMISKSQFEKAQIEKENFILHVVELGDSEDPSQPPIHTVIVNPAKHFTKLQLDSGWREFDSHTNISQPAVGLYLASDKDHPEVRFKIDEIKKSGSSIRITTSKHTGLIYRPSSMLVFSTEFEDD